ELAKPLTIEKALAPGVYNIKYRVDFQDGSRPTEGVTDLVVGSAGANASYVRGIGACTTNHQICHTLSRPAPILEIDSVLNVVNTRRQCFFDCERLSQF